MQVFPFLPCVPATILTDNGPEFVSAEFSNFLSQSNVKHQLTTPYFPSSNGAVERVNRTIIGFLLSLATDGCSWRENLPKSVVVYNNTLHAEINVSISIFTDQSS